MRAQPKRLRYSGLPGLLTHTTRDGGLWIECEVTGPPSMVGRSVDVYLDPESVLDVLRASRDAAVRARQTSEVGRVDD